MAISDDTNNKWLAKPSGTCCLKGTIHKGDPRGIYKDIAGVETYISRPATGTENGHILLYFPDVWGMFPNSLLVMDAFADAGYLVLGLDYFRGVRYSLLEYATSIHQLFQNATNVGLIFSCLI